MENANMFVSYEVSLDLIECVKHLAPVIAKRDRNLADQMRRAATSVTLNLAEGAQYRDGNRSRHYNIAHGSAYEVKAAVDVAMRFGWIEAAPRTYATLDRLLRLLWGLTRVDEPPAQRQ
jgi:four helix bundle protein